VKISDRLDKWEPLREQSITSRALSSDAVCACVGRTYCRDLRALFGLVVVALGSRTPVKFLAVYPRARRAHGLALQRACLAGSLIVRRKLLLGVRQHGQSANQYHVSINAQAPRSISLQRSEQTAVGVSSTSVRSRRNRGTSRWPRTLRMRRARVRTEYRAHRARFQFTSCVVTGSRACTCWHCLRVAFSDPQRAPVTGRRCGPGALRRSPGATLARLRWAFRQGLSTMPSADETAYWLHPDWRSCVRLSTSRVSQSDTREDKTRKCRPG